MPKSECDKNMLDTLSSSESKAFGEKSSKKKKSSRKRLRIKVTPDLHLTYSKNGGNPELVLKIKNIDCISIVLTKHVKYIY